MVFSSMIFIFRFLPIVLAAYYILPKRCRNLVLFISSLFFYAWGEPVYVVLILASSLIDYIAGWMVSYCRENNYKRRAVLAVVFSVTVNLSLLCIFKYGSFLLDIICTVTKLPRPHFNPALPIGISFYTFQTMSYTIDIYRKDAKVQKNFITYGAYVSLFPQLVAGPIIRFKDIAEQLDKRKETAALFCRGVIRFAVGLGKKVLIANQIGELWKNIAVIDAGHLTTAAAWLGVLAFTLQIYFDFSGYSDMAIGLGMMFGFIFPENFNYPYESKSITEFWRRWHISLGTWFREYVYIPLGGNRKGVARQMVNLLIVWMLTGLWHGAGINFIMWGIYYGILIILEKLLWKPVITKLPVIIRHIYTMLFVMIGWSLFSIQDVANGKAYIKAMFMLNAAGTIDRHTMYLIMSNLIIIIVAVISSVSFPKRFLRKYVFPENTLRKELADIVFMLVMFFLCTAMLVNSSYNPFLYFRF